VRAGRCRKQLEIRTGDVALIVPMLRTLPFESAIIDRCRRREGTAEVALVEVYLAGVGVRRVG